jgi:CheY-like chemotaxis protein
MNRVMRSRRLQCKGQKRVVSADDGEGVLALIREHRFDPVRLDGMLPG